MGGWVTTHIPDVDSILVSGILPYTIIVDNFEAEYEVLMALILVQNTSVNSLKIVVVVFFIEVLE